jgi:hypothetical protein
MRNLVHLIYYVCGLVTTSWMYSALKFNAHKLSHITN